MKQKEFDTEWWERRGKRLNKSIFYILPAAVALLLGGLALKLWWLQALSLAVVLFAFVLAQYVRLRMFRPK